MSYSFSETFYYLQKFLLHPPPPHGKIGIKFILKLWLFLSPELSGYYKLIKFYFQLLFFLWLDFYSVTLECKQSSNPYELLLEQLGISTCSCNGNLIKTVMETLIVKWVTTLVATCCNHTRCKGGGVALYLREDLSGDLLLTFDNDVFQLLVVKSVGGKSWTCSVFSNNSRT